MTLTPNEGIIESNSAILVGLTFISQTPMKLDGTILQLRLQSSDEDSKPFERTLQVSSRGLCLCVLSCGLDQRTM